MPNWHEARRDLDPELGVTLRLFYRPPLELVRSASLADRGSCTVDFTLAGEMFR
jgi:hypothetical protein